MSSSRSDQPYQRPTMDEPLPHLNIPRATPTPRSTDYVTGWGDAARHWRSVADRATDRLIRERFYFAASLFVMLAALLFLTVVLMAAM